MATHHISAALRLLACWCIAATNVQASTPGSEAERPHHARPNGPNLSMTPSDQTGNQRDAGLRSVATVNGGSVVSSGSDVARGRARRAMLKVKTVFAGKNNQEFLVETAIPQSVDYTDLEGMLKEQLAGVVPGLKADMTSGGPSEAVAMLDISYFGPGDKEKPIANDADWQGAAQFLLKSIERGIDRPLRLLVSMHTELASPPTNLPMVRGPPVDTPPPAPPKVAAAQPHLSSVSGGQGYGDSCEHVSVARLCCGPNATKSGAWCTCNPGFGCTDSNPKGCSDNAACPRMVSFHINNAHAVCNREKGGGKVTHEAPFKIPKKRSECNPEHTRFIHIDKSGGTSVKEWLKQMFPEPELSGRLQYPGKLGHIFTFGGGCPEDCYTFFLRDPARRWASRYLMRMRMSQMPQFKEAGFVKHLRRFATPNALAEALSSTNATLKSYAELAWKSDAGPAKTYAGHFLAQLVPKKTQAERFEKIFFVGSTKTLTDDFKEVCRKLGLPMDRFESSSEFGEREQHNAMPTNQKSLATFSELGMKNAAVKLHRDYQLLQDMYAAGLIDQKCTGPQDCDL